MDTSGQPTAALVTLKAGPSVKSRLAAALPPTLRSRLAWAMNVDTLTALAAATGELLVVSDRSGLEADLRAAGVTATVIDDGQPGMNEALALGDRWLRARGHATVLACVGDLPSLDSDAVRQALAAGDRPGRHYVADRSGIGTTMLLARGIGLDPRFQGESARAHAESGADALVAVSAAARCDVDTIEDLAVARTLGVGAATTALLGQSEELRLQLG